MNSCLFIIVCLFPPVNFQTFFCHKPHGDNWSTGTFLLQVPWKHASQCTQIGFSSVQWQVIDYGLPGREHSAPSRCVSQDSSCHKWPVMQQTQKQFVAAQSQWAAPLSAPLLLLLLLPSSPPPLLKLSTWSSPYPHRLLALLNVNTTKRTAAQKAVDGLRRTTDH